jgi:hypothetical protein
MLYKISYDLNNVFADIDDFDMSDMTLPKYLDFSINGLLPLSSKLPRYKLNSRSKVIDLIQSTPLNKCLVISDRVVHVFEQLNLPLHQYFDLSFVHRKKIYDQYKALYIARDPQVLDMIDWEQSEFYKTKDWHQTIIESYKFNNWDQMLKTFWSVDSQGFGFLRKLKLRYDDPYDINYFPYPGFPMGYICTEKVKALVEEKGFTGFRFEPVEDGIFI